MFVGLLAYRMFKQVHYMYICTYSEASTAAGYGWNMSCGRVEQKEEHETDLVPNGEVEWIFGREMWNSGPEYGIMEGGT